MSGFNRIFEIMGRRSLDFADCPYAWVYALPPSCAMLRALEDAWSRITQVVAALEVAHAVLADQNDYHIDGIFLTLSKDTIDMLRTAACTLMSLDSWALHPAAPGTHDILNIVLHAVDTAARHNTAAFQA